MRIIAALVSLLVAGCSLTLPEVPPAPMPVPPPPMAVTNVSPPAAVVPDDALSGQTVKWFDPDLSKAAVTGYFHFVRYNANDTLTFDYDRAMASKWPRKGNAKCRTYAEDGCAGFFFVAKKLPDGTWVANKFEHIGADGGLQTTKLRGNIRTYVKEKTRGAFTVAVGDTVAYGAASYGLDVRTPAAEAIWK